LSVAVRLPRNDGGSLKGQSSLKGKGKWGGEKKGMNKIAKDNKEQQGGAVPYSYGDDTDRKREKNL